LNLRGWGGSGKIGIKWDHLSEKEDIYASTTVMLSQKIMEK
jgi:hypothetical protein